MLYITGAIIPEPLRGCGQGACLYYCVMKLICLNAQRFLVSSEQKGKGCASHQLPAGGNGLPQRSRGKITRQIKKKISIIDAF